MKENSEKIDFFASVPFTLVHLACLAVFLVGWSKVAVITCFALYGVRMFGITGGYHRYFSHRSYKTSRLFQFVLAVIGASAGQKGPLWWAAHHRHHHKHSDTEEDLHSPGLRGLWWSHVGWFLCKKYDKTNKREVKDLNRFAELRALNYLHWIPPVLLATGLFSLGEILAVHRPTWGTSGWQMLVWGFFVSTVILYHGTFVINSLAHKMGKKRFKTGDDSKNSLILALITLGEGWHNNHHRYPGSERQGFYWWEVDITHYVLKVLSWLGIVWDLRVPPKAIYDEAKAAAA